MSAPAVRVVIDRLVLHGVARADAAAVRRALVAELEARLAAGLDLPAGTGSVRLQVPAAPSAAALGRAAGGALAASLSPPRTR